MTYISRVDEFKQLLKSRLNEDRYIHSLNVADSALELACAFGVDKEKAYIAGLLHDVCKNESDENQLQIMRFNGIILNTVEMNSRSLWHAISGAVYVKTVLGVTDEAIINAIRYHTTGRAGMTKLEKVIYVADFISADREYSDVDVMRSLAKESLDSAALYSLCYLFNKQTKKGLTIHPDSVDFYNELILNKVTVENINGKPDSSGERKVDNDRT